VIRIVWEFRVREGTARAFEALYSAGGAWANLFAKARGYERTVLLKDGADPRRYLTIDVWRDAAAHEAFLHDFAAEYQALDREGEALTESERCLGRFADLA
jgi:heme-degrading monooxygenase HmoA